MHGEQHVWRYMWITGFPIQILLYKYKVEVISRLIFTFITHNLQEHLVGPFTLS